MNPDISNIGSILNNSVAPNVTLKRNTGSADSPLSPDYINSLVHHQRSPSFQGIVLKIFFMLHIFLHLFYFQDTKIIIHQISKYLLTINLVLIHLPCLQDKQIIANRGRETTLRLGKI